MNKCAFIAHPVSVKHFVSLGILDTTIRRLSKQQMKEVIQSLFPIKLFDVKNIKSLTGKIVESDAILCPLLPEQMVMLDEQIVLKKIISAGRLAQRLGVKIVGLGGFISIIGDGGLKVARELDIPVTSGNTYTAALAIEGIFKASELLEVNLKNASLAIIGATGDIGSICTKILANYISHFILAARNERRLEEFGNFIQENYSVKVEIKKYIKNVIKNADIILTATSSLTTLINPQDLKPGAIVCDISYPANIARELANGREDVLVFEGGLATWSEINGLDAPGLEHFCYKDTVFGCVAETFLLTLEEKFENYSLGRGNITEEKINEISDIAKRHGFRLADFRCGEKIYTKNDIEKIKYRIGN